MERTSEEQEPEHAFEERIGEFDTKHDTAERRRDAEGGQRRIQPHGRQRRSQCDDEDADGLRQPQKEMIDDAEGSREHHDQRGDLEQVQGRGPPQDRYADARAEHTARAPHRRGAIRWRKS